MKTDRKIRTLIEAGVYCPRQLFDEIYPTFVGHYSVLRDRIAEIKNNG